MFASITHITLSEVLFFLTVLVPAGVAAAVWMSIAVGELGGSRRRVSRYRASPYRPMARTRPARRDVASTAKMRTVS